MLGSIDIDGVYDPIKAIVLYKDAHVLVVSKPAGMLSTSGTQAHALTDVVKALDATAPHLHPTSRLDRQVSGIVTFARTRRANHHVLRTRTQGRYQRQYLGLARAGCLQERAIWTWPIGLDPRHPKQRKAVVHSADAAIAPKPALTHVWRVAQSALVDALMMQPQTGRTHQLRVHAAAAGAPLLGDVDYGGARDVVMPDGLVCWAPRVMLHCGAISLPLPDQRVLTVRLSLPDDMQHMWEAVTKQPTDLYDRWRASLTHAPGTP